MSLSHCARWESPSKSTRSDIISFSDTVVQQVYSSLALPDLPKRDSSTVAASPPTRTPPTPSRMALRRHRDKKRTTYGNGTLNKRPKFGQWLKVTRPDILAMAVMGVMCINWALVTTSAFDGFKDAIWTRPAEWGTQGSGAWGGTPFDASHGRGGSGGAGQGARIDAEGRRSDGGYQGRRSISRKPVAGGSPRHDSEQMI